MFGFLALFLIAVVSAYEYPLYAGQNTLVGNVNVTDDGEYLHVDYTLEGDWELAETHLYVGKTDPKLLTTAPGQFPYYGESSFVIPLSEIYAYKMGLNNKGKPTGKIVVDSSIEPGVFEGEIYIAAHAVVKNPYEVEECVNVTVTKTFPAPYYPEKIISANQGLRKDGTPVLAVRSVPAQGLAFETGQNPANFYSLGFGGDLVIELPCPLTDGDGYDFRLIEDTWGSYPIEKAEVFLSTDGSYWVSVGFADNTVRDSVYNIHTTTYFEIPDELQGAKYLKIVDVTNSSGHTVDSDGYDLNAVEILQSCSYCYEEEQCEMVTYYQTETAWARYLDGGIEFPGANWATYVKYEIQKEWVLKETLTISAKGTKNTSLNSLQEGEKYLFRTSGTCNWRVPLSAGGYLGDAEYWLRHDAYREGWTKMGAWSLVMFDGTNKVDVDWGNFSEDHIYEKEYLSGATAPVTFFFGDDVYSDNSGFLTVEIYQWE